jgi:hypothetical protein
MAGTSGANPNPVDSNRAHFIAFFKKVLRVSDFVATALYDQQLLTDAATIAEFGNSEVDSVCQTLRRDSKLPIAELSIARLKLLTFWVRHQQRTGRAIGGPTRHLVRVDLADLELLKEQKRLEDGWAANNKEPEYTAIALDLASAAKAFEKVKTLLTRIRGVLGVLLVYVIRHQPLPDDEDEDPEFGGEDHPVKVCKYSSHDQEMIARCPIISEDADWDLEWEELEIQGPFVPTFLTDNKKVWAILHALFSTSSVWQHVKKFTTTQDGRQVYRTLHSHFFGKDKVNTMVNDILSSLKSKIYQGDRKNFNFDKYCLAHVAEHNRHASLTEYDVAPLEESMKIHYFEEGIKDPTLDAARNAILVNRSQFPDFDSVMQLYMTSKRSQKSEATPPGRQLSAVTGGRGGGGRGRGRAGRGGRGRGDPDARQKGLVSQADIDRVTTVENKHYPEEVYAKFSAAEKAKHWQLRNPGKERGTGSTGGRKSGISATTVSDFASAISSAVSAISALSDTTKRNADDEEPDDDTSNRKNPALARQAKKPKSDN